MAAAGWGARQLTREELLTLARKLHSAQIRSVMQANRSTGPAQMRRHFAVAADMSHLWGEVVDELIVRRQAGREPEAR